MGVHEMIGHGADLAPTRSAVKAFAGATLSGIEQKQSAAMTARFTFHGLHERRSYPPSLEIPPDQKLVDLAAMRRIRLRRQVELHGADYPIVSKHAEEHSLAAIDRREHAVPIGSRHRLVEGQHIATSAPSSTASASICARPSIFASARGRSKISTIMTLPRHAWPFRLHNRNRYADKNLERIVGSRY